MHGNSLTVAEPPAFLIEHRAGERTAFAVSDLGSGLSAWRLFIRLGWLDIKLRYRGSMLGPFWLTLSTAVWALSMGLLYAELFQMDVSSYMPYLSLALVLWNGINAVISDACVCFTSVEGTIRSLRLPFTIYAMRLLFKNALIVLHNVPVVIVVFAIFGVVPSWNSVWSLPGLLLWFVDGVALCMLLGSLCARFRDVGPIVASVMQIAFFLTPVIWQPELVKANAELLLLNPFYPVLAIILNPWLDRSADWTVWAAAFGWSALLVGLSWPLFVRVRGRIAFWV